MGANSDLKPAWIRWLKNSRSRWLKLFDAKLQSPIKFRTRLKIRPQAKNGTLNQELNPPDRPIGPQVRRLLILSVEIRAHQVNPAPGISLHLNSILIIQEALSGWPHPEDREVVRQVRQVRQVLQDLLDSEVLKVNGISPRLRVLSKLMTVQNGVLPHKAAPGKKIQRLNLKPAFHRQAVFLRLVNSAAEAGDSQPRSAHLKPLKTQAFSPYNHKASHLAVPAAHLLDW